VADLNGAAREQVFANNRESCRKKRFLSTLAMEGRLAQGADEENFEI